MEGGNWKLVMENNRECYHCEGHPELACSLFPTYGYEDDEVPTRLRPAFDRYLAADADLRAACEERGLPHARIEELSGRSTGFRIQREPLDGAGESFTPDGTAVSGRLLGDLDTARLGRLSMHLQPNAWFHFLADHVVTFSVLPLAPDRTLVRTTWLVHEDAVEGVDYDLDRLTHVWRETNRQDGEFVARAQAGASARPTSPGPTRSTSTRSRVRQLVRQAAAGGGLMTELMPESPVVDDPRPTAGRDCGDDIDQDLVCTDVVQVTHDVRSFVLAPGEPRRLDFRAGQYLTLRLDLDGREVERCYTISSPPTRPDRLTITVKRVPQGPVSNWLHDRLEVGDRLRASRPHGRFTLEGHPAARYLLLTGRRWASPR